MNASIIATQSSGQKQDGEDGSEMKQSKKGNQWHFGMRLNMGVDAQNRGLKKTRTDWLALLPGFTIYHLPSLGWRESERINIFDHGKSEKYNNLTKIEFILCFSATASYY